MYLDIAKRIVSSVVFAVVLFSFEWFVSRYKLLVLRILFFFYDKME
jgi:hypothetical protein